jgi:hypothetical protein
VPCAQDARPKRTVDLRQCGPIKPEVAQLDSGQVQRCIHVPSPIRTFVLYVPEDEGHYRWLSALEAARQQSRPSKSGWLTKQGERVKVRPQPALCRMTPLGADQRGRPLCVYAPVHVAALCVCARATAVGCVCLWQNWKRRWFVLLDRQLIYYETENVGCPAPALPCPYVAW